MTDETEQILEEQYGDTEGLCDRHGPALTAFPTACTVLQNAR
jgi:hypothetical protein